MVMIPYGMKLLNDTMYDKMQCVITNFLWNATKWLNTRKQKDRYYYENKNKTNVQF